MNLIQKITIRKSPAIITGWIVLLCLISPVSAEQNYEPADRLFLSRLSHSNAVEALQLYRDYFASDPGDPETAWRVSMACYFAGYFIAKSKEDKKKLFAEGRDAGLISLKLNPNSASSCFWTAVNMTLYGQTVGVIKMFFTLKTVKALFEKSCQLDPGYAHGGAYRMLGKIEQEVPALLGGSSRMAKKYYEEAIRVAPDEPLNYLFLADLQYKIFKDKKSAYDIVMKGLSLPVPDPSRYESLWASRELKKFAKQLM
ncbi:MAG: TRAP transporter TatT component family protein [Thermodesulfobacteriota bacterium]